VPALVELIEAPLVLKEIRVQTLFFDDLHVGLHVVGEHFDIQLNAFFARPASRIRDFRVGTAVAMYQAFGLRPQSCGR
jgi:hypothetical protein